MRTALPRIEVRMSISYDAAALGPLSEFVIDLNEATTEALLIIGYELGDGQIGAFFKDLVFQDQEPHQAQKDLLCRELKIRVPELFSCKVKAIDPNDDTNIKELEWSKFQQLVQSGFINAQRGLDDITDKDKNVLGNILEALLTAAKSDAADPKDRSVAEQLEEAVEDIQQSLDQGFNKQLEDLLPAFTLFGYPGLSDPQLRTETILDVRRLLINHTRVRYIGLNGVHLPEAYNGLGTRNLIFMLLKLLEFFKRYMTADVEPGIQLIFIEEPEVHLHPQMQEVFISTIGKIADAFAKQFADGKRWPVQFVITTHSSHVANRAPFDCIRYFLATSDRHPGHIRSTRVKDFNVGLSSYAKPDRDFLHKYMTLTRSDLYFADKAVLIEGPSERLLLPKMIEKIDVARQDNQKLSNQYLSVVEVGGAYMHLFYDLLKFLEVRTLVITDLDTVYEGDRRRASKVSEGTHTSNAAIKNWFDDDDIHPRSLLQKSSEEKTDGGIRRLAYQIPEAAGTPCGRSFEAAFMLANLAEFELADVTDAELEQAVWDKANDVDKKTDFALDYAINRSTWTVPRYIAEGLRWLSDGNREPQATNQQASGVVQRPTAAPVVVKELNV